MRSVNPPAALAEPEKHYYLLENTIRDLESKLVERSEELQSI